MRNNVLMKKLRAICVALALCAGLASASPAKKVHSISPAKARKNAQKATAKMRKNATKNMAKARSKPAKARKHRT
jgi:hypothetical protein